MGGRYQRRLVLNPGHGQRTADSGQRTAASTSTLIETRHSESLITVWTAQRHVPCWAHLPFMKGQDDTIIVRRLQAVCVGVVSVRLVLNWCERL